MTVWFIANIMSYEKPKYELLLSEKIQICHSKLGGMLLQMKVYTMKVMQLCCYQFAAIQLSKPLQLRAMRSAESSRCNYDRICLDFSVGGGYHF